MLFRSRIPISTAELDVMLLELTEGRRLLVSAIGSLSRFARPPKGELLWARVADVLNTGSLHAIELCRVHGWDPDKKVRPGS